MSHHAHLTKPLRRRIAFLLVGNLLLLTAIFGLIKEGGSFLSVLQRAGPNMAPVVLAGFGMTAIILTGAIDLSIASIIAVAGTVFGILVQRGMPPLVCFAGCLLACWGLSITNGWLIRRSRLPAIIITLAGLTFYRGLALILADLAIPNFGGSLAVQADAYHGPGKFYPGWILFMAVAAALLWEHSAATPRRWAALGSSEEACRLAGLDPQAIQRSTFHASGILLGLAALIYVTRVQYIEPARLGLGFELQVIGAVVLGGTNIFGSEGSFLGTLLGATFLYLITEVLIYAGVSPYFQEALAGALILGVIGLDCALHRRQKLQEELA